MSFALAEADTFVGGGVTQQATSAHARRLVDDGHAGHGSVHAVGAMGRAGGHGLGVHLGHWVARSADLGLLLVGVMRLAAHKWITKPEGR